LTPRRVTYVLYGVSGIAAALSLLASILHGTLTGVILVVSCGAAWWGIHKLRFIELHAARQMLFLHFRHILEAELTVLAMEESMAAATTLDECWQAIVRASDDLDFAQVRLRIGSKLYEKTLKPIDPTACWSFQIPLSESDYIVFKRAVGAEFEFSTAVPFFNLTRKSVQGNLKRFQSNPRPSLSRLASA